jgi:hypothetical protein
MKALLFGLGIGVFASAFAIGFFLALARAAAKERPKPLTGTLHERMEPRAPRMRASHDEWATREAERLRAELDDPAAVAAWLSGGSR